MNADVVYIEFYDKKLFPVGPWSSEPDFVRWKHKDFVCLAIRDMHLGMWRGFVGLPPEHLCYSRTYDEMINKKLINNINPYGGIAVVGKLPPKYNSYNENTWWIGFETTQGDDLIPLIKYDLDKASAAKSYNLQTYKTLSFIRKETNYLANKLWINDERG